MSRPLPIPSRTGHLPARVGRQVDGEIARIEGGLAIARAIDRARVRRLTGVTEDALVAAARLSTFEALAVDIAPHAAGRLKIIADMGSIGLARIVEEVSGS